MAVYTLSKDRLSSAVFYICPSLFAIAEFVFYKKKIQVLPQRFEKFKVAIPGKPVYYLMHKQINCFKHFPTEVRFHFFFGDFVNIVEGFATLQTHTTFTTHYTFTYAYLHG